MWILYQLAVILILLFVGPILLLLRGRHYLSSLPGRLGIGGAQSDDEPLWIHAVSVGEAGVARTLVEALPAGEPILVSTVTPTGQAQAGGLERHGYQTAYLPFELGWPIRRFLDRFRPRALVLCEGDYWPLLLRHVKRRGMAVMVINGRIGDRSFRRMRRLRPLLGALLGRIDAYGVQTEADRHRLIELGVEPARVRVTGNMKFDAAAPERHPHLEDQLEKLAAGRPILIAGSTMPGEEEGVLEAFHTAGGGERAMLLLAPRHPERWNAVAEMVTSGGQTLIRRSDLSTGELPDVVLLDSMGELAGLYAICRAAFIGGTLVPTGGHNPLEPARFGVAIAAGPSMENFRAMAEQFGRDEAWERVDDAKDLAAAWGRWLNDPAAARKVGGRAAALVETNRGALDRTLELLAPLFGDAPAAHETSG